LFLVTAASTVTWAETIAVFSGALTANDSTQMGRLSRNGIQQDWLGSEPYPGEINPTTTYLWRSFVVPNALLTQTPFIQISFDDPLPNTFISAYEASYNPASKATHWLGDEGISGNFGPNPNFFQVVVDPTQNLILVVNSTNAAAIGEPFGILVEGFVDTQFTDPTPIPEPTTLALLGTGLLGAVVVVRRRVAAARD
jgi:hypothetical protein